MQKRKVILYDWASPCGRLTIGDTEGKLVVVDWTDGWHHRTVMNRIARRAEADFEVGTTPLIERTVRELNEYFAGRRREFDLPLVFYGTDFQVKVWQALQCIPYGHWVTYGDIAREAGSPKAVRAVGVAVGENPFSIIVPCHRVVGKDKTLTGYGGGYAAKRKILALEMGVPEEAIGFEDGAQKHGHGRKKAADG